MKRTHNIILSLLAAFAFVACNSDDIDTSKSIYTVSTEVDSEFDKWLKTEYVDAYNIDYKYRMSDIESDMSKNLAPAEIEKSMQLAQIIKHAWLEAYEEVAGIDFIRANAPAILHVIGSASWNEDGTWTLGTAEGGLKITLYMANWLNPQSIEEMNEYFFKTMHHEFTHILQQTKNYPQEYNLISAADYRPSGWFNRRLVSEYAPLGFVTSYAGSSAVEDITEVTTCYITFTDQQWQSVFNAAGTDGTAKLNQKIEIMKGYMLDAWNIDMDELKEVVSRRMQEVLHMQLIKPEWATPLKSATYNTAVRNAALQMVKNDLHQLVKSLEEQSANEKHTCQVHQANYLNIVSKNYTAN